MPTRLLRLLAFTVCLLASFTLQAQGPLAANQTLGFGADQLLTFTYTQQFHCVVEPNDHRNYGKLAAELDPKQLNFPQCQIGWPSSIDPVGNAATETDPLYVLVPFFETNPKEEAFSKPIGTTLKSLFGIVPDAFKRRPGVAVQCPEPGRPIGTCTMHPTQVDLGPVLHALNLIPANTVVNLPLVNHSHVLDDADIAKGAEWWQVIVVLVTDPKAWPTADGSSGITSVAKLRSAQSAGQAFPDVASNFYLFFSSDQMGAMHAQHQHQH